MTRQMESAIRGCVLGAALGDALGAPFEFRPVDEVAARAGGWIDGLYSFEGEVGPHGLWISPAPPGTGTDDSRYNWLFAERAAALGKAPTDRELADLFLAVHERPEEFFSGNAKLARTQFAMFEGVARGCLGEGSALHPGISPEVLRLRSIGLNYPTLIGLISLTPMGLLFPGEPGRAYEAVYLADFYDVGYGREATALLAAGVSAGMIGELDADGLVGRLLEMDPLQLGDYFGGPFIKERLPSLLDATASAVDERETAERIGRDLRGFGPFDPFRCFGTAVVALQKADGDPLRSLRIAVNQIERDEGGTPTYCMDVDCYAAVAGALAGALWGAEAFPDEMLERVVESNREVYGFDLECSTAKLIAAVDRGVDR